MKMRGLNSPFKLEHFGDKHTGSNQFYDPFTKGSPGLSYFMNFLQQKIWIYEYVSVVECCLHT